MNTEGTNEHTGTPGAPQRMSDAEGLMWRLEKDPFLSSTYSNVSILDKPLDFPRFMRRIQRATIAFPRLRQRVQPAPANLGAPFWQVDPNFDLNNHVRHIALPQPGTMRQLCDLATLFTADPFDRTRPPWQFLVIDGLEGGRGALISKIHHTIADGEGGVLLSMQFLDLERDAPEPPPLPEPDFSDTHPDDETADVLRAALNDALRIPLSLVKQVRDVLAEPTQIPSATAENAANIRSILKQLGETDPSRSPLWTERSLRRHLEILRAPYSRLRDAAKELGGTLNSAFVTAAADAAGEYHRRLGAPVESLRTSMAVSTRTSDSESNAFTLVRLLVPTGEMPIAERFAAIDELSRTVKAGSDGASLQTIAGIGAAVPTSVLTRLARAQSQTVDFATSNVKGAGIPLYVAGSRLIGNYPVGPLAGVAFNLTLLSHDGNMDMGLHIDAAAVTQPGVLRECMEESFERIMAHAPQPAVSHLPESMPLPPPEAVTAAQDATPTSLTRPRWWRRRRASQSEET
jgi:diacylglycerol O-acyltransferase